MKFSMWAAVQISALSADQHRRGLQAVARSRRLYRPPGGRPLAGRPSLSLLRRGQGEPAPRKDAR